MCCKPEPCEPCLKTTETSYYYPYVIKFGNVDYKGNMLHHLINDSRVTVENLKYVIAFLQVAGCEFYKFLDSNSVAPCLLAARRAESYPLFSQVAVLVESLEKRLLFMNNGTLI